MSKTEFEPKSLSTIFGGKEAITQDVATATKAAEPSPEPVETKAETVPEAKPKEAAPEAAQEKPKEAKAEEKPAEAKPKEEETKKADPWDTPDNPYKKRYEDTRNWARGVDSLNRTLQEQAARTQIIEKKIDGTYDPEKDAISLVPSPEQSEFMGRFNASLELAVEEHGTETMNQKIAEWNERFGNNPIAQQRLRAAPNPIHEGLKMLDEQTWTSKWGGEKPSPQSIEAAIRADEAGKWKAQIADEVNKAIRERFEKVSEQPKTLSAAKGSANNREASKDFQPKPLSQIFGR